jgi:hypothetical protein
MDRSRIRVRRLTDPAEEDDFVPGTAAERIAMVWPLTVEIASLDKRIDVHQKMQRHIVRVIRRQEMDSE